MKLLVTGGAGFIGSNFIRYWSGQHPDDKILNIDNLTYAGNIANLADLENQNYSFIEENICNKTAIDKIFTDFQPEIVVHFAAETHVDRSLENPSLFIKTNILGTYNLLEASLKNKIKRFHHISTDEVFGSLDIGDDKKFRETSPYGPSSPYSASKAASDHLVRSYAESYDLPISITNCSNNFGPYQYPEKFLPRIITNLIEDKNIPVYGDGKNVRDWLYVEDHCRAIEMILLNDKTIGKTYCVGGNQNDISNLDITKMVLDSFGLDDSKIEFIADRPGHDRKYAVDWSLINKDLGWEPKHNTAEWLEETIKWYRDNSDWWQKLKIEAENFYAKK